MTNEEITELLEKHKGLIPYFIKIRFGSFPLAGYTADEMWQIGRIGLFYASRKYQPEKGVPFAAYAKFWIFQAVISDLQSRNTGPSIGANTKRLAFSLKKYCRENELSAQALDYTDESLQEKFDLSEDRLKGVINALQCFGRTLSLDAPLGKNNDDADTSLEEFIPSGRSFWDDNSDGGDPEKIMMRAEQRIGVREMLREVLLDGSSGLTYKQKELLRYVYSDDNSIAEVARDFGMLRATAHYRLKQAWKILRRYFQDFR